MEDVIYHGQVQCSATLRGSGFRCTNRAYFRSGAKTYLCGVHKDGKAESLPKMPKYMQLQKTSNAREKEATEVEEHRVQNGGRGELMLYRMKMMKNPEYHTGFLRVFPNYRHQNRSDGFGCSSLSPMSLGPVEHGQPGLPPAKNIENFHQGSKCFPAEINLFTGKPAALFYENQRRFFLDDEPHRHKYNPKENGGLRFFVWIDKNGEEHHLTYVQCRQFYCTFYERLAKQQPDFHELKRKLNRGYNLQICGYDAHPIEANDGETMAEAIERAYLAPDIPFGHERVLFTLLTLPEEQYPWRKHKMFDF